MNSNFDFDTLNDATVYDSENKKIGTVGDIYFDDVTNEPKFVTVNTGLFGMRETFVPFLATNHTAEGLSVPYTKDFIKDAPNVDADGHLTPDEERRVFEYYDLQYGDVDSPRGDRAAAGRGDQRDTDRRDTNRRDTDQRDADQRDTNRRGTGERGAVGADGTAVAHEERLRVGKDEREAGQVRLRKRVRTEHQSVEVPVQREELVVERERIDPNSAEAHDAGRINATDAEETVTLREEVPVVDKETVATEQVNVDKRTVQDTETVSGEVRKEEIDVETDDRTRRDRR